MAYLKASDLSKYERSGGTGFFSIANNKEKKTVRFMYDSEEDIQPMAVHKIKLGDRDRYVNCPREYNDPVENCPFCKKNYSLQVRLFIPLYNEDENVVQLWDRGSTWVTKVVSLCENYAEDAPLVSTPFKIQRNGEAGDKHTTYETYAQKTDNTTLEDLPEVPEVLGGLVLDKSYEDMEYYTEHKDFPKEEAEEERPRRRGSEDRADSTIRRRTPAGRDERF